MITRQLVAALPAGSSRDEAVAHPDSQAALELLRTAVMSCRFEDPLQALVVWRRWLRECVVIGTFDDDGVLITLRAYERLDGTTLRQRGLVYAAAALAADGVGVAPRVVRGILAWYRHVGATRIVSPLVTPAGAPLVGPALETWQARAARVGATLVAGLAGAPAAVVYEVDELERRLGA